MHFSSACLTVLSCDTIRVRLCIYLIDQKIVMEEYSVVDCSQANSRCEDGMGPNAPGVSWFEMEHLPSSRFSVTLLRDLLTDDFQQVPFLQRLPSWLPPKGWHSFNRKSTSSTRNSFHNRAHTWLISIMFCILSLKNNISPHIAKCVSYTYRAADL